MPDITKWAEWIIVALGIGGMLVRIGKVVDKQESQGQAIEVMKEEWRADCRECQAHCQENTWNKLMLALEKRDREFDRKFSTICQGISDIKAEIKRS